MNENDIESVTGKAQLSCTVPIPLYLWARAHAVEHKETISGFITRLIKEERTRREQLTTVEAGHKPPETQACPSASH